MNRVRSHNRSVSDVTPPPPSLAASVPVPGQAAAPVVSNQCSKASSNAVPSDAQWDLITKFSSSSVPKYSLSRILGLTAKAGHAAATSAVVDALNLTTLKNVGDGLQSAPARLAVVAPLLSGATIEHKAKILAELNLSGVPVTEAMSAIDTLVNDNAVHTALWVRPDFTVDQKFASEIGKRLGTEIISIEPDDLKGMVDSWSFGWTHGRLIDLVSETALKDKQVVVTSAMPNDLLWEPAFGRPDTIKDYPFDKHDGSTPVPQVMMTGVVDCTAAATGSYRAAALPMNNGQTFIAVVPAEGVPVESITQALSDPQALKNFFASFVPAHGAVYVPKMRVVGMSDVSASLGSATKGPYEAVGSEPVTLGNALAAASIKLDEEGIANAGGGSAHLAGRGARGEPIIECARPFLFMLRSDATGLIKAAGVYRGPDAIP